MKNTMIWIGALALATTVMAAPRDGGIRPAKSIDRAVSGQLGSLAIGTSMAKAGATSDAIWMDATRNFLRDQSEALGGIGTEEFAATGVVRDELGQVHVRVSEMLNGLPVDGADMIVHADAKTGRVFSLNGRFTPDENLSRNPRVDANVALTGALKQAGISGWTQTDAPRLTYVVNGDGFTFLAWTAEYAYTNANGEQRDQLFADAITGKLVARHPHIYQLKSRATYTANNGTTLPGTLKRSEGGAATGDATLDAAHDYAGNVYDYYKNVHGRDSYDNAGAQIKSSVHYSTSYNNAFWNGSQMVYGDGDGTTFIPLSKALDVDAHELTHAVTERTAGLVYSNESGALNEATSDILGNSCEAYSKNGGTPNANTWKVGEDIYTPATAGDALRYMNDPALAGDYDYYPTRYTGTSDNGGVHSNSGIANLAYYKMVMGGTHPRSKTTINVTPLSTTSSTSLNMAQKIWYRALTVYFTSSTSFSQARTWTKQAATDLYGATAATSVDQAWQCVGVGTTAPPPACTNYSGSLAAGGSAIQPNGTYYYSAASGTHTGKLTGPSGADFDLYLYKWNGSAWAQVASSTGTTAVENISYSGTAGYYEYKVVAYSGSGSYTLCLSHPN